MGGWFVVEPNAPRLVSIALASVWKDWWEQWYAGNRLTVDLPDLPPYHDHVVKRWNPDEILNYYRGLDNAMVEFLANATWARYYASKAAIDYEDVVFGLNQSRLLAVERQAEFLRQP